MTWVSANRFRDNEEGTASVEFIIMAPLLLFWLLGSFVWYEAYRSKSLTSKTAYTVSDIATRYTVASNASLNGLFEMHKDLLPKRLAEGWMRVSSICWNGTSHRVLWSYLGDDTFDPNGDAEAFANARLLPLEDGGIPVPLMPKMAVNDSIILTEVFGRWVPVSTKVGLGQMNWTDRLVSRPRFSSIIPFATPVAGYPHAQDTLCPADEEEMT